MRDRSAIPWHRRLEARVAIALALLVAGALGALPLHHHAAGLDAIASVAPTTSSTWREPRSSSLLENRAASAIALTTLVTELPVFRAHLTDHAARLGPPNGRCDGRRLSSPARGRLRRRDQRRKARGSRARAGHARQTDRMRFVPYRCRATGCDRRGGRRRGRSCSWSSRRPARFADEVLGTLTVGYRLTDALAQKLARLAQCEVILISEGRAAA